MANVLLGVTGSVAAIRTPELFGLLRDAGHRVRVVATTASLYFFNGASLEDSATDLASSVLDTRNVFMDEDEWPGREEGRRYRREDPVLHIELRRWAELLVIAPLDANTLAKLANGLADNCLTCVWRAWDPARPVVLAPAMNTLMWENPLTARHLRQLLPDGITPPRGLDHEGLVEWINKAQPGIHIVAPVSKRLACGDVGVGAMADLTAIVAAVDARTDQD